MATFGPATALANGGIGGYLAQYNGQGAAQWLRSYGGPGTDSGGAVVAAPGGELYTVGFF